MTDPPEILLIEPFYGGSHKQLMDLLAEKIERTELVTMTAKKWHWRARTAGLYLSQAIPAKESYRVLFASSVLNLSELVSLRPDLGKLKKVLYFHENQLVYPVRKQQDRDFQYGYNQVLSCLVADVVVFNSKFNQDSFLDNIGTFMKLIPDYRPKYLKELIKPKCRVIHFPLTLPPKTANEQSQCETMDDNSCFGDQSGVGKNIETTSVASSDKFDKLVTQLPVEDMKFVPMDIEKDVLADCDLHSDDSFDPKIEKKMKMTLEENCEGCDKLDVVFGAQENKVLEESDAGTSGACLSKSDRPLHIVWPHRWEHDKGPEVLFDALYKLKGEGLNFKISVLGETYLEVPDIFLEAKDKLFSNIRHWGFMESKEAYFKVLREADVVVSTAHHEFFGVAMLESVHLGCYPLCPNRLVYPEIFPKECIYNTDQQLFKRLRNFCRRPESCRKAMIDLDVEQLYSWSNLEHSFKEILSWKQ